MRSILSLLVLPFSLEDKLNGFTGYRVCRHTFLHLTGSLVIDIQLIQLPHQDSNLGHLNQNQRCCRYTMGDHSIRSATELGATAR